MSTTHDNGAAGTLPCIAVAGASGFVGQALVHTLRARGHRVRALARRPLPTLHPDNVVLSSFAQFDKLAQALAPARVLLHLAARAHQTQPGADQNDALFAANLDVTQALLHAAQTTSVARVVLVSSIGVNGRRTPPNQPFTENDHPAPVEAYARSKLRCEQTVEAFCRHAGMAHVIVRPPLVHGPRAPGNFGRLLRAVSSGWPLPLGAVDNRRSLIGLDNLVDALALCAVHPAAAGHTYLVSDGQDASTRELVCWAAEALGTRTRLWPVPELWLRRLAVVVGREPTVASLCDSLQVSSERIRDQLNWQPPLTLRQGLAKAVEPLRPTR